MIKQWIAYETKFGVSIKHADEPRPWIVNTGRPATPEEISEEMLRRDERQSEIDRKKQFSARPEVRAAEQIRGYLEMEMENVIDKLEPKEWLNLLARLEGGQ